MRTRNWSIRAKIISLLLIPLVTLVGMWALATYVTVVPGIDLIRGQTKLDNVGRPGGVMLAGIQAERRASVIYLATGRKDASALIAQRGKTDAAIADFRHIADTPDTRGASSETFSTHALTSSITSSHSPSTLVNMALVSWGSPLSRTRRTASATAPLTESPVPIGVMEKAAIIT